MFREFIGSMVDVAVVFALACEGAAPVIYTGTLVDCDDKVCKLRVESARVAVPGAARAAQQVIKNVMGAGLASLDVETAGTNMIINNNFIASVTQVAATRNV